MTFDSSKIVKGIIAGFIATVILTLFMMLKKMVGVMPQVDPVHMMSSLVSQILGIKNSAPLVGSCILGLVQSPGEQHLLF